MSINVNNFFFKKTLFNQYLKDKKFYFFLLGLTISIGDLELVISTVAFLCLMVISYQIKSQYWLNYIHRFTKHLTPENKKLFYSIVIASFFSLGSYFSLNIWTEIDNKWLAFGIIIQTIFSGAGLIFLANTLIKNKSRNFNVNNLFEKIIEQLNDSSPLKRLWAVNQVILQWHHQTFTQEEYEQIREYLTILKDLETEPIIISKIDHCLELITPFFSNNSPRIPINNFPLSRKKKLSSLKTFKILKS